MALGEDELTRTCRLPKPFSHSHTHALCLSLCLAGNSFPNYNIREYVRRRAREEFSKEGTGKSLAAIREELEVVRRQGVVYGLYNRGPVVKSVMDLPNV